MDTVLSQLPYYQIELTKQAVNFMLMLMLSYEFGHIEMVGARLRMCLYVMQYASMCTFDFMSHELSTIFVSASNALDICIHFIYALTYMISHVNKSNSLILSICVFCLFIVTKQTIALNMICIYMTMIHDLRHFQLYAIWDLSLSDFSAPLVCIFVFHSNLLFIVLKILYTLNRLLFIVWVLEKLLFVIMSN